MVLLAGLVLALGPGGDFACLASDDAGVQLIESPRAIESDFVPADEADWKVIPDVDRTQFGQSVASAGNVDGYHGDDVIVGAPLGGDTSGEGTVYLYLNTGVTLSSTRAWQKSGGVQGANFGASVAGAGDVNGDTYDDIIIGAPGYKTDVKYGSAVVYKGEPSSEGLSDVPIWSYIGTVQDGEFGYAVASAGDVNGDGVDDIVVGARSYTDQLDDSEKNEGAVYVFFGSEDGPSTEPDWLIDSDQPRAWLGAAVSAAGDVNHDGYGDLLVGSPKYVNPDPESGLQEGAVFLFLGRDAGETPPASVADAAWTAYGGQEFSWFGDALAGAGDVNGDGYSDIVVGAPQYDRPFVGEVGAAFAFCGNGSTFESAPCWTVYGGYIGGLFGVSVGGAGDVNADGYDDVIIGAPHHFHDLVENRPEGAAFLYFGSEAGLATWAGWKARGDKARTDFGTSVASAGLVTGGEAASVIVGAPQYFKFESEPHGGAFAFYGPLEPAALYPAAYLPLVLCNAN